mgnify:FL=1
MKRTCLSSTVILVATSLAGCGPESTHTPPSTMPSQFADSMDVDTWDFGDKPASYYDNQNIDHDQYAIVVATFTGGGHLSAANATLTTLSRQYLTLAPHLKVRERSRGSAITYGSYSGYDDVAASKDIKMLQAAVSPRGAKLFGQIMLSKFKSLRARRELHPFDLWTVRREYPTVVPIYTLEVAVWGDFESGQLPNEQRRKAAERYASELRTKGFEAFFYHSEETELSSVTVGLFSYKALDPETGFYSTEVEAMLSRFPSRLVNGQPVLQYFDPGNPSKGSTEQKPCLAEVPVD